MIKEDKLPYSILVLAIISVVLAGCGLGDAPAGRKPSPDFSRGVPLSTDVGGTHGMLVEAEGKPIHFVFPTATDDQAHIRYQQINELAEVVVDVDLDLPQGRQRTPRLLAAGDGQQHLFWGLRAPGSRGWALWHALLDSAGDLVGEATRISEEDTRVGDYTVTQNASGDAFVIWEVEPAKGLWAARVSDEGVDPNPMQLTETGESPAAYLEEDGTLHLTWLEDLGINYAEFVNDNLQLTAGHNVVDLQEIIANLDGPVVGVAGDWVYVLWSVFARSGLESGTGWTEYIAFPAGEPSSPPPTRVWMLTEEEQPYVDYDSAYQLSVLAPAVTSPAISSSYILEPDPAAGRDNELAVAISTNQTFRLEEYAQMAVLIFEGGEFTGYEIAGKTESFSMDGILQSDSAGHLFLAWREGTGNKLYFAATEPGLRDELGQLGRNDVFLAIVGGGLEAVTGALFFPLALVWFVPGGLLLGLWKLRRDDETINDAASRVITAVAIVLYQATKILFLPSMWSYVPFSAWLDVSAGLGQLLRIMVPVLVFAIGLLVAEFFRRRRDDMSSLLFFFIACAIDALLTLMIYGVNFLGVF
jgi:hypothetical protein